MVSTLGLPFKESRFAEKISHRGDKSNLAIYIPSEISGIFGQMVKNHSVCEKISVHILAPNGDYCLFGITQQV